QLQSAASIFVSLQSEPTWQLALEWFCAILTEVKEKLATMGTWGGNDVALVERCLHNLRSSISNSLVHIFENSEWKKLKHMLEDMFSASPRALSLLSEQPWDLSFNPQACQRAAFLLSDAHVILDPPALSKVQHAVQRLHMVQLCLNVALNLKEKTHTLEKVNPKSRKKTAHLALSMVSLFLSHTAELLPEIVLTLSDSN
ncbi:unnamed protein product, partial [Lymnaea stagnalis]